MAEKYCSKCGNQLKVDDKYCLKCRAAQQLLQKKIVVEEYKNVQTPSTDHVLSIHSEKRSNTKELPFSNLNKLIAAKTDYRSEVVVLHQNAWF